MSFPLSLRNFRNSALKVFVIKCFLFILEDFSMYNTSYCFQSPLFVFLPDKLRVKIRGDYFKVGCTVFSNWNTGFMIYPTLYVRHILIRGRYSVSYRFGFHCLGCHLPVFAHWGPSSCSSQPSLPPILQSSCFSRSRSKPPT